MLNFSTPPAPRKVSAIVRGKDTLEVTYYRNFLLRTPALLNCYRWSRHMISHSFSKVHEVSTVVYNSWKRKVVFSTSKGLAQVHTTNRSRSKSQNLSSIFLKLTHFPLHCSQSKALWGAVLLATQGDPWQSGQWPARGFYWHPCSVHSEKGKTRQMKGFQRPGKVQSLIQGMRREWCRVVILKRSAWLWKNLLSGGE